MKTVTKLTLATLITVATSSALAGAIVPPPTPLYSNINIANTGSQTLTVLAQAKNGSVLVNTPGEQVLKSNQSAKLEAEGNTYGLPEILADIVVSSGNYCTADRTMGGAIALNQQGKIKCTLNGDTVIVQ